MVCVLEASDLYKEYPGGVVAVKGVSLKAGRGRVSLMGPNGSGKTTTLSMLAGALKPSRGVVRVCGYDLWGKEWIKARRHIGYALQKMPFREKLSGMENLIWYGLLRGLGLGESRRRARSLSEELGLSGYINRSVASYSGGMRKRLSLAAALMGDPDVLILDEPTSGLDPRAREELWHLIEVSLKDLTIVFSAHMSVEAELHSDYVYIFNDGVIVAEGRPSELIERYAPKPRIIVYVRGDAEPLPIDGVEPEIVARGVYMYPVDDPREGIRRIVDAYSQHGVAVERIETRKPGLEEVFFTVTGRRLEEG